MIKAVIIDDNAQSNEVLNNLIRQYCNDIEVAGVADTLPSAYQLIANTSPDLVFLDVYMPPSTGFELLKQFPKINFETIFITAFDQYAINAIRCSALDYLLKPVDPDSLQDAVARFRSKSSKSHTEKIVQNRILLPVDTGFMFLPARELVRAEIKDKSVTYIVKNRKPLTVNGNLTEIEDKFTQYGFFRCHRAHIINIDEVVEYVTDKNGGCVVMSDSKLVPVAARRKEDFLKYFSFLNKQ